MKLELKHLASYLPYGFLYGIYENQKVIIRGMNYNSDYLNIDFEINNHNKVSSTCFFNEIKPILRPLSDLEEFSPAIYNYLVKNCENYVVRLQQIDYNVLIENHFDVFGLIENGLATDINSLPQSSE